uniref:RGS domain-containing protein n=1 Tax=Plectus sambesii TaxID=2011161 RepID=A0A914VBH0_9BILA
MPAWCIGGRLEDILRPRGVLHRFFAGALARDHHSSWRVLFTEDFTGARPFPRPAPKRRGGPRRRSVDCHFGFTLATPLRSPCEARALIASKCLARPARSVLPESLNRGCPLPSVIGKQIIASLFNTFFGNDEKSLDGDGSNGEYWNRPAAVANNHHHQHRQEDDATNDFDQTSRANLLNGDATSDTSASTNDQNGHRARHLGRQRALTTNSSASSTTTGSSSWLAPLKSGAASQPATPRGARRFFGALVSRSPLRKLSAVSAPRKVTVEVERPRRVLSASRLNDMDGAPRGTKPVPVTFYEGDDELAGASTSAPKCYLSVHQSRISEEASGPSVDGCMRRASSFSGRENVNGQPHPLERKGSADDMPGNGSVEHLPKHDADFKKMFSFTGPLAKKLSFLNKKKPEVVGGTGSAGGHSDAAVRPTKVDLLNWATCFDNLLKHKYGCQLFRTFLQREFSEENIDFWIACEEYKRIKDPKKLALRAKEIYIEFVAVQSPKEVNLDSDTRSATQASLAGADRNTFDSAQYRIEHLMEKDSYPRFLKSELYTELLNSIRK